MGVIRVLTDRGTEFCGKAESHDYQLYLALDHNGVGSVKSMEFGTS